MHPTYAHKSSLEPGIHKKHLLPLLEGERSGCTVLASADVDVAVATSLNIPSQIHSSITYEHTWRVNVQAVLFLPLLMLMLLLQYHCLAHRKYTPVSPMNTPGG